MLFISMRGLALGLLLAASLGPAVACSRGSENAERRGLAEEREVAVPESTKELSDTTAERSAKTQEELEQGEEKRFQEAEKGAHNPPPAPMP